MKSMSRIFAIGDIHGCSIALQSLLRAIDPKPDDTIVVLGDVIDCGPDSRACVQQLIDLSSRCRFILVRGNHEEMLFNALESRSERRYWLSSAAKKRFDLIRMSAGKGSSTLGTSGS